MPRENQHLKREIANPTLIVTGADGERPPQLWIWHKPPKMARFSMPQGHITFEWYAPLSAEDAQDIRDWLKIVERQILRMGVEQ